MSRRRRHRLKLKSLYVWHRWVGLVAALFVIVLAGTGLALNHTEELQLDARHVRTAWLLDWYGISLPDEVPAWRAGEHWISQWDQRLYLDAQDLGEHPEGRLRGAVAWGDLLIVALDRALLLLTGQGELVEKLAASDLPGTLHGIALAGERPVLLTDAGHYAGDDDLVAWQPLPDASVSRPDPAALPSELAERIAADWRGSGLSLERVILDVHSGRILGTGGVYLMDAAAVLLLFLSLSGSGIWIVRAVRNRQRGHKPRHHAARGRP